MLDKNSQTEHDLLQKMHYDASVDVISKELFETKLVKVSTGDVIVKSHSEEIFKYKIL